MRGIVLISHGPFAQALTESLKMIAGPVTNLYSACLEPTDGPDEFKAKCAALQPELDQYDSLLIFADLLGGSPCNTAFSHYISNPKVQVIAGMNFPIVLTALLSDEDVPSLIQQGRDSIVDVRAFTSANTSFEEDE